MTVIPVRQCDNQLFDPIATSCVQRDVILHDVIHNDLLKYFKDGR